MTSRSTITPAKTDKPRRKKETPALMFEIIQRQMAAGHVVHVGTTKDGKSSYRLACPKCGLAFDIMDKREREHLIAIELGGADDATNQQYWHKRCSKKKTFGEKQHVKVDGDISKIAKAKRLAAAQEAHQRGEKKASRMQSRPFNKKYRKRFNGTVERRA